MDVIYYSLNCPSGHPSGGMFYAKLYANGSLRSYILRRNATPRMYIQILTCPQQFGEVQTPSDYW